MHAPTEVDVFIEGAVEFDFERIGERGRIFVRVVLRMLTVERRGNRMGVWYKVDEDLVANGAGDFVPSILNDNVVCCDTFDPCGRRRNPHCFHNIPRQFCQRICIVGLR